MSENPFATAYENVDTFFNACNLICLIARSSGRFNSSAPSSDVVAHIHALVDHFVNGKDDGEEMSESASCSAAESDDYAQMMNAVWAADVLTLLNVLFPTFVKIGQPCLLDGVSKASPAARGGVRVLGNAGSFAIDDESVLQVRRFWSAFTRDDKEKSAWQNGVAPLLELLLDNGGSHDVSMELRTKVKHALEKAVRAVWLVHSSNGVALPPAHSPLHDASSPERVCRVHIDPRFVGDERAGIEQRASTIGLKPHTYRQILTLLLGSNIDGVVVNAAINEGGLGLRVSSDATILDERGELRTDKATSPVQTEGVQAAYGNHDDRVNNAVAQRSAWDMNALLLAPIFVNVSWPRDEEVRTRGEIGTSAFMQKDAATRAADGQLLVNSYVSAKHALNRAANPKVAHMVERAMSM